MTRPASPLPTNAASFEARVRQLPPEFEVDEAQVARAAQESGRVVVAIDDDPTGTQTVAGVPLLTTWSVDDVRWAMREAAGLMFILANTRGVDEATAVRRNREIVAAVDEAARLERRPYALLSRSDSTLRGHAFVEPRTLAEELEQLHGRKVDGILLCPAYFEASRMTLDNIHWTQHGGQMTPVAKTDYARDATFGYSASDLCQFIAERAAGHLTAEEVLSISVEEIRIGGVDAVAERLVGAGGAWIVINAVTESDLAVVALAVIEAERRGATFVYRTGPTFVRVRAGLPRRAGVLPPQALFGPTPAAIRAGLVVVGSHVALTARQLRALLTAPSVTGLELPVTKFLDPDLAPGAHQRLVARASAALAAGQTPVIYTSREVVRGRDELVIARRVSDALVQVTRAVIGQSRPDFVVAKGGITSHDIGAHALSIDRGWVRGSMLPGLISVWQAVEGPAADIPYVVFPGNVGADETLADIVYTLRKGF